jgi:tetratricopeptide (TPR) repeat protein
LSADAVLAEAQAREILKVAPGHADASLLLAAALRAQGKDALGVLEPLAAAQPFNGAVHYDLGCAHAELDQHADAISAFKRAVECDPDHAAAWRALGDELNLAGDANAADQAYARHIKASVNDPRLIEAATALCENRLAISERLLRTFLMQHPTDVAAIRMLAEVGARLGRYEDAERLLKRAVELAPSFVAARANYAAILHRQNKPLEALRQIDALLDQDPRNPAYRNLMAAVLARLGETDRAIGAYEQVLKDHPRQPKAWMSLGHTLKTAGRQQDAIDAYRKSIALLPSLGEAYWSLANLKTFRFSPDDVAAMQAQLDRRGLAAEDRYHLHFALGKALEDEGAYADSFGHYDMANALRRAELGYDADEITAMKERLKGCFTADFFAARAGQGSTAPDPIFIVGLPRSGSTLIEQILASHSAVEGTAELPDIMAMIKRLGGRKKRIEESDYPRLLESLGAGEIKALGEEYLERTRIQRRLGKPFFIDKMPNNFLHTGFIHLILPNAKIIDARRHPMGCCFSCFKQHFARGQGFTYSLTDIGRYYADYAELMAHYDAVLPGRVHRIHYESMVTDPENEVRRLLDYCELPFEEGCLLFYQNERIVRTASSEQVRQPIFADAVEHWRNFEPWLGPLKQALGSVLEAYPAPPVPVSTR